MLHFGKRQSGSHQIAGTLAAIFALTLHSFAAAASYSQDTATRPRSGAGTLSLVQAGSTGGNVGQVDKSTSGVIEKTPQSKQPKSLRQVTPTEASCKLASVWANEVSGLGSSVWTITSDGTATEQGLGGGHGHAVLSGHTLTINFRTAVNFGKYSVLLNQACAGGSGKSTVLGGFLAGVYNVNFTAAPAATN